MKEKEIIKKIFESLEFQANIMKTELKKNPDKFINNFVGGENNFAELLYSVLQCAYLGIKDIMPKEDFFVKFLGYYDFLGKRTKEKVELLFFNSQ